MAYEKRQSYKFEVVEVNGDFVIVKSKEGNTYKVKLLDGLTAKDLPKKISCVVDSVFPDGNLKLIMDRNPFLREYYKVGKVYSFTVGAKRSRTVNTFYYPLRGVFGFMPQYPAPDGLVIPEGLQEFRVVEYDQKNFKLEYLPSNNFTYDYSTVAKHVPAEEAFALEDLRNDTSAADVCQLIDANDKGWLPALLKWLKSKEEKSVKAGLVAEASRALDYYIRLSIFLLEDSRYLNELSEEDVSNLRAGYEKELSLARLEQKALSLVAQNEADDYIRTIFDKLKTSGYLTDMKSRVRIILAILEISQNFLVDGIDDMLRLISWVARENTSQGIQAEVADMLRKKISAMEVEIKDYWVGRIDGGQIREKEEVLVKLYAALWLLVGQNSGRWGSSRYSSFDLARMLRHLSGLVSYYARDLLDFGLHILRQDTQVRAPFGWSDLIPFNTEIVASKIANISVYPGKKEVNAYYENHGTLLVSENKFIFIPKSKHDYDIRQLQFVETLSIMDNQFGISLPRTDKLSQTEASTVDGLKAFFNGVAGQAATMLPSAGIVLKDYVEDDTLYVKVSNASLIETEQGPLLYVESIDPAYNKTYGYIRLNNIYYYPLPDWEGIFEPGNLLKVKAYEYDEKSELFDFRMIDFLREYIGEAHHSGEECDALLNYVDADEHKLRWITEEGYSVTTEMDEAEDLQRFNIGRLRLISVNSDGFAIGEYIGASEKRYIDKKAAMKNLLDGFMGSLHYVAPDPVEAVCSSALVGELLDYVLQYQMIDRAPLKSYRLMGCGKLLATMLDDRRLGAYIDTRMELLRNQILFGENRFTEMKKVEIPDEIKGSSDLQMRLNLQKSILAFGNPQRDKELFQIISDEQTEPEIRAIAKLTMAANLLKGNVPESYLGVLKREIASRMALEQNEEESSDDQDSGKYVGMEGQDLEFKSSYVYPPNNHMQPDVTIQRKAIMATICAFLNTDNGGRLLLGVSDAGYVVGLDDDLNYLHCSLDQMINAIRNDICSAFGAYINGIIDIKPIEGDRVLEFTIHSSDKLVEYNGIAWQRQGNGKRQLSGYARRFAEERKKRLSVGK